MVSMKSRTSTWVKLIATCSLVICLIVFAEQTLHEDDEPVGAARHAGAAVHSANHCDFSSPEGCYQFLHAGGTYDWSPGTYGVGTYGRRGTYGNQGTYGWWPGTYGGGTYYRGTYG